MMPVGSIPVAPDIALIAVDEAMAGVELVGDQICVKGLQIVFRRHDVQRRLIELRNGDDVAGERYAVAA